MIGSSELIVILALALLLFGPTKLPELARSLGRTVAEFNKAKEEFSKEELKKTVEGEMKVKTTAANAKRYNS